ncbi:universal stress protein [Streptomyces sp. NPDC047000]|uniref:universal stress protein n=1 Tax=Streptomyces sp. NPDC047000 TaxID=3155474 RepID=UPI0033FA716A
MLARVIAGVDGSTESLAATEWAAREAERRGRPLRLVYAWTRLPRSGEHESAGAVERYLGRRMLRGAEDRVRTTHPGLPLDDRQIEGPAAPVLTHAAGPADLLVLGSRGHAGRLTGLLLGSVSRGVLGRATRPVVLVRAGHRAGTDGRRDVVVGLDAADISEDVLAFAFEAAHLRQTRLHAVYASPAPGTADDLHRVLSDTLHRWRDKYPDVPVVETVTAGRARTELLRAAADAALLVVGHRRSPHHLRPRTGRVTQAAVVHDPGCPVAIIPHD